MQKKQLLLRYSTYAGCFLIIFPNGLCWFWGNLSVYTDSYMRAKLGPDCGFETPWTLPIFVIFVAFGVLLSDVICNLTGSRCTFMASIVIFDSAMFLSYFAVQNSVAALVVTAGVMAGLSFGIVQGQTLRVVSECTAPERVGVFSAAVTLGFGIGALCLNEVTTFYINPNNEQPDLIVGPHKFFTQTEILDQVPTVFLVIGGFSLGCHMVGFLLVCTSLIFSCFPHREFSFSCHIVGILLTRSKSKAYDAELASGKTTQNNNVDECKTLAKCTPNISEAVPLATFDSCKDLKATNNHQEEHKTTLHLAETIKENIFLCGQMLNYQSVSKSDGNVLSLDNVHEEERAKGDCGNEDKIASSTEGKATTQQSEGSLGDLTSLQMLKTQSFYILWLCVFCSEFNYIVTLNFYKTFGQMWIEDDQFLTLVGTSILIGWACTRVFWGALVDACGVKLTLILFSSCICIGSSLWYFTPMLSKWLYMAWTVMLGAVTGGFYVLFPLAALKTFGPTYYARNFGLLLTASVVINLVAPPAIDFILQKLGWFGLFFSNALLDAIGLIVIIVYLPAAQRED